VNVSLPGTEPGASDIMCFCVGRKGEGRGEGRGEGVERRGRERRTTPSYLLTNGPPNTNHPVLFGVLLYASVYFRAEMSASSQDYKRQIPKLWLWFELLPS